MTEISHLAPLWCPHCGGIVEVEDENSGSTITYYCEECDCEVDPVPAPPPEPAD
jgi:hypothetical protein